MNIFLDAERMLSKVKNVCMARLSCEKIKTPASHLSISTRQATHTGKSHGAAEFL
jgi:hypothetical protein